MPRKNTVYVTDVSKTSHLISCLNRNSFKITVYSTLAFNPETRRVFNFLLKYLQNFSKNRNDERIQGVIYKSIGIQQFIIPLLRHVFKVTSSRRIISFINNLSRIKLLFVSWKYDVIIATEEVFPFFLRSKQIVIVEVRGNLPISTKLRCETLLSAPLFAFENTKQFRFHWKRILNRAEGFLVYSDSTKKQLELSGISSDKIAVQPPRILDFPYVSKTPHDSKREIKLLYVGRDGQLKGLDIAVAVSINIGIELGVVGNFSKKTTKWLNQFELVTNFGALNHDRVLNLMSQSHILLSPGVESYGYVILEALENGCIIVSSQYCGAATWLSSNPNVFISPTLDLQSISQITKKAMLHQFQQHQYFNRDLPDHSWNNLIKSMIYD